MDRRDFVHKIVCAGAGLAACPATALSQTDEKKPIVRVVDSHIHLFDPNRPGGVPWPMPGDSIYKPTLPQRYQEVARGFNIVGAIAIEASPLPEDNDWLLKVVENDPSMLGMIGDLVPGTKEYAKDLNRLHKNPLFLGIRYGNLWSRDLAVDRKKPGFMDGLRDLSKAHLVFESANPNEELVEAILAIVMALPDLTIVVDHLPHEEPPSEPTKSKAWLSNLRELSRAPNVFVKLSEISPVTTEQSNMPYGAHPERLDLLWDLFGPDRVIFGSDWPNSDHVASYADTFSLVKRYVTRKGPDATNKFFFSNSHRAYRWKPRTPSQMLESPRVP